MCRARLQPVSIPLALLLIAATPTCTPNVTVSQPKIQDNNLASSLVGAFNSQSRNYDLNPPDYRSYEPSFYIEDKLEGERETDGGLRCALRRLHSVHGSTLAHLKLRLLPGP